MGRDKEWSLYKEISAWKNWNLIITTGSEGWNDVWKASRIYVRLMGALVKQRQRQVLNTNNRQGTEDVNFNRNWASRVLDSFVNLVLSPSRTVEFPHLVFLYNGDQKEMTRRYLPVSNKTYWCGDKIALCMNESKLEGSGCHQFCNGKLTFPPLVTQLWNFDKKTSKELNRIQVND